MTTLTDLLTELESRRDKLTAAIDALRAWGDEFPSLPPPNTNGTAPVLRLRITSQQQAVARKNGQANAAAARKARASDHKAKVGSWRAKAEPLLRSGKSVAEVAKAAGVSQASTYTFQKALGLATRAKARTGRQPKAKAAEQPLTYRCQHCGAHGTDPKRCSNLSCLEPR